MPGYLESLTARLAAGTAQLPPELRTRHANYLAQRQNEDGGFSGREGPSDLYYTGFALRGLALLGELHGSRAELAANYLRNCLQRQAAVIDFLSLLYGASLLRLVAQVDVFSHAPDDWPTTVAATLESFRREDGGYAKTTAGGAGSTYYTFLVVLCYELIARPVPDAERIVRFVQARQRDDGGFVEMAPMRRSGTNPTAAAAATLKIFASLDPATRQRTVQFLAQMQADDGGLRANTRIPFGDVLSTFTGLLTLADLDALDQVDTSAAQRYVEGLQGPEGGFQSGPWDEAADVEYTFYGLGTLALLGAHDFTNTQRLS